MLKWMKFILKLELNKQILLKEIIDKILTWDLSDLDIKKLTWKNNYYRCRKWKIRIIFYEENKNYYIHDIDFRWWVYKK